MRRIDEIVQDGDQLDAEQLNQIHEIAIAVGHAFSTSYNAAMFPGDARVRRGRDKAWMELADRVIEFAVNE